jgi:hypothetical protein
MTTSDNGDQGFFSFLLERIREDPEAMPQKLKIWSKGVAPGDVEETFRP